MKKSIMICYCLRKNLNGLKKDLITRVHFHENARTHIHITDAFIFLLHAFILTTLLIEHGSHRMMWGQTLSRSYGRCIAEFLSEGSLVSLSLLDSSTCVGLRYGRLYPHVHLLF